MLRRESCSKIEEIVLFRSRIESRKLRGGVLAGWGRGVGRSRGGLDGGEGHGVDAFGTGLQQGVGAGGDGCTGGDDVVDEQDALVFHLLRMGGLKCVGHIFETFFQGQTLLLAAAADAEKQIGAQRYAKGGGKGACHPLRNVVASPPVGGRTGRMSW